MNRSESLEKLAEALALAQAKIVGAEKDKTNPHFKSKYADLASIWDACRGALTTHGLSVVQTTRGGEGGGVVLETTLLHSSGQWISGELHINCDTKNPQAIGSALTYCRRYSLAAIVGVCPEDDDGETAAQHAREQRGRERDQRRPERFPPQSNPAPILDGVSATKLAKRFESTLNQFCQRMNAAWIDRHTDESGEIPPWVKDLANPYQMTNHMLKEAGVQLPEGGNFGERQKAAAKLWQADEAGTVAGWKRYVKSLADEQERRHADEEPVSVVNGREPGCDDE